MSLLFKHEHVQSILDGRKTQTRRLWSKGKRVNVGSVHQARTRMLDAGSTFARLQITRVWREPLYAISEADARAEGYASPDDYLNAFARINRMDPPLTLMVWCVEFERVEE